MYREGGKMKKKNKNKKKTSVRSVREERERERVSEIGLKGVSSSNISSVHTCKDNIRALTHRTHS